MKASLLFTPLLIFIWLESAIGGGWASLGPDTSKGTNIKQIVFTPSGDLLAVSDRGIIRHSYDTVWNFTLHNYYPPAPSLQDPSRDAEQIQIISPNEMLVGWNGMLVNVGEPTAGLGHTQVNNAHWGIDVWSGGGFPTAFNILAEHPPGTRLFADLYGLKVSNDSGMTWNPYPNSPHLWNSHFLSIDRSNRYLYSTNTAGLISFDLTTGGTDTLFPMDFYLTTSDILVTGDTLLLGVGNCPLLNQGIYRSIDRGATWIHVLDSTNVFAFGSTGNEAIMYAGGTGVLFKSINAGLTWFIYNSSLLQLPVSRIVKDPNSDTLYVATDGAGVLKVYASFVVGVEEPRIDRPANAKLDQNFPNPFNPVTTIEFTIDNCQLTFLMVYDLLGKEVATIVNEVKQPGAYSIQWDAGNLPSGVYVYRLWSGGFVESKKLLLLK